MRKETTAEAFARLEKALKVLGWRLAYMFYIPEICYWLERQLDKLFTRPTYKIRPGDKIRFKLCDQVGTRLGRIAEIKRLTETDICTNKKYVQYMVEMIEADGLYRIDARKLIILERLDSIKWKKQKPTLDLRKI